MLATIDTEFTDFIATHLISLGIVAENGDEFYVEISDYPRYLSSGFVKVVVEPLLIGYPIAVTYFEAANRLAAWLEERPGLTLVGDFSGDYELTCKLLKAAGVTAPPFKNVLELFVNPADETAFMRYDQGQQDYFNTDRRQHHALVDAKAMMQGLKRACLL